MLSNLNKYLQRLFSATLNEKAPAEAYDIWSNTYDAQPNNLVLALDEVVFSSLLEGLPITGKVIADVGCGTGRHWQKILEKKPVKLIGFDVSRGMLDILQKKFPHAATYLLKDNLLPGMENDSCHVLVSTLALAHIQNMPDAITEWNRVVKPGGDILVTDFHPEALKKGGNRTFRHNNKLVSVKNYTHELGKLRAQAVINGWEEITFIEKNINEDVRHYYETQHALAVYERFKNTPVIYGIHFKKVG